MPKTVTIPLIQLLIIEYIQPAAWASEQSNKPLQFPLTGAIWGESTEDTHVFATLASMMFGFRASNLAKTSHASDASLEELLAFERLLSELSARFANVSGEQVVAEIESALKQLLAFLGFDRSTFAEFADEGKRYVPSSAAVE